MKRIVVSLILVLARLEFAWSHSDGDQESEEKFVNGLRSAFGYLHEGPFNVDDKEFGFKFVPKKIYNRPDFMISPDVCQTTLAELEGQDSKVVEDHKFELSACIAYLLGGNFEHDPSASDEEKKELSALADERGIWLMYAKYLYYFHVPALAVDDELVPT